jgi:SAM-dependent methyltransferase
MVAAARDARPRFDWSGQSRYRTRRHEMGVSSDRRLRRAVATVLFVNAFLVFVLQPHITKRLLPVLGGSAEVWMVCTLFFQLALLAGYAAAYGARRLPLAVSLSLHAGLVGVAWLLWPFATGDGPPGTASPPFWTLQLLVGQVGLLFTALTATSPLLQTAFARAAPHLDPYPLFAASNAGSLAGLFSYPLLVEPLLTLDGQAGAWRVGALGLLVLLGLTARALVARTVPASPATAAAPGAAPPLSQRLRWLALGLVPSVLLLSVTAQITIDIAPVPLLWMLPLGLYLGSFIRVFASGWQPSRWTWPVMAVLSLPMVLAFAYEPNAWWWGAVHLGLLWCGALLCHGALVRERPAADRLAEFYLWLALGGALGGVFAGMVAPLLFTMRAEYPLAVLAVLWLAPRVPAGLAPLRLSWRVLLGLAGIGAAAAAVLAWATKAPPGVGNVFVLAPSVAAVISWHRPRVFAVCTTVVLLAITGSRYADPDGTVLRGRTFYGTHSVRDLPEAHARALFHGTTLHGLQSQIPGRQREPLSYYGATSPVADVFRERVGDGARVAVIGLGAGVILRYAQPGSRWTVYEIDPAIARIAQNPTLFSHWAEAAVVPDLIVGDGRLRLRDAPDAAYDLIVVDAFSSDAIPVHLLTREALLLYDRKLRPGGAMLFNVSNRYIDLAPMLGATARPLGLVAYDRDDATENPSIGLFPSQWVLVGRSDALTAPTAQWTTVDVHPGDRDWTDDYSNVLAVLRPVRLARDLLNAAWRRVSGTAGGAAAAGGSATRPR